jgi:PelA/Pel-15E family pectate lyase
MHNRFLVPFSLLLLLTLGACARSPVYTSIPMEDFGDAINHWVNRTRETDVGLYKPHQILEIADNILLYQRDNGGWPTNKHPARILTEEEKAQILADKSRLDGSFDNRNVYPQVEYLSWVYLQTGDIRYREGALNGLRYTLDKQYENGGWSHSPDRTEQAYYRHITFADDIMPDILTFLRKVAVGAHPYGYVARELRAEAAEAVRKGDELLLRLQVVQDGELTVWAGQYHEETLVPAAGRSYELPALQSWESTSVVKYLMSLEDPSEEVIAAVEAGDYNQGLLTFCLLAACASSGSRPGELPATAHAPVEDYLIEGTVPDDGLEC